MPCDTSPEIPGDNVSAKHNDILFELLLYSYNHNTLESTLWQATGNSQVKIIKEEVCIFHLFALIFGFGYGGLITMLSLLVADLFGLCNHGLIFGTITFIITIGGSIGPFVGGYIFDLSNSYYTFLLILLAVSATGSVLISLLKSTTYFTLPLNNRKRPKNNLL